MSARGTPVGSSMTARLNRWGLHWSPLWGRGKGTSWELSRTRSPPALCSVLSDLVVMDTKELAWVTRAQCAFPRCSHSLVLIDRPAPSGHDGLVQELLCYGGWTGAEVSGDLLVIDPQTLKCVLCFSGCCSRRPVASAG